MVHAPFAYLHVKSVADAVGFYTQVFGAKETLRLLEPGGRAGHLELDFDGTTLMLSEEFPEYRIAAPSGSGTSVSLVMAPQDQFCGERWGVISDPAGHRWNIGHHLEDVPPEEMQRRYEKLMRA